MSLTFKRPEVFYAPVPRILDFDVEARPLGWLGGDWVHKEVTAIATAWIEDGHAVDLQVWTITKDARSHRSMLRKFLERYNQADIVTGHYIREFDLPLVNGAMMEFDLPGLGEKLTHDTKLDLVKHSGMSKSQENLSAMAGLPAPKVKMTMVDWREVNRLTPEGLRLVKERAVGDVLQHVELRQWLLDEGRLGPPKLWVPGGGNKETVYTP